MSYPFGQGGGPYGPPTAPLPTVAVEPPGPPPNRSRNLAIALAALLGVATVGLGVKALALRGDVDDRDTTIEELRDEGDRLNDKVDDLEDDAATTNDELATANSLIESYGADVDDAETELASIEADLDAANERLSELEAAAASSTTTTASPDTTATTAAPNTTATTVPDVATVPSLPPELAGAFNDGSIDETELSVINTTFEELPDLTLEQAQGIADRVCVATSVLELREAVTDITTTYLPGATVTQATVIASAVGSTACNDALLEIIGS